VVRVCDVALAPFRRTRGKEHGWERRAYRRLRRRSGLAFAQRGSTVIPPSSVTSLSSDLPPPIVATVSPVAASLVD